MSPLLKKELIGIGAALLIVAAGLWWFFGNGGKERLADREAGEAIQNASVENVKVPEPNSADFPSNVAIPDVSKPSVPGIAARDREFTIVIQNNVFVPDTVVVRVRDTMRLTFTAVDKAYDVVQPETGLRLALKKGETKLMAGTFSSAGKLIFYCTSCGGPAKGPVGYIIIASQ